MAKVLTAEGKVLQDLTTRFQVYLERVKTGQIADIDDVIREFSGIAESSIGSADLTTKWKVRDLTRNLSTKMRAAAKRYKKKFTGALDEVATTAANYEASSIGKLASKKVKKPTVKQLKEAVHGSTIQATGTQMEAFIDSWSEAAVRRVTKAVNVGAAQGLTNQEIVQQVRGTRANKFRDGILGNATKREANAMVRTAVQHAASEAQAEVYRDNDDIIEGYIWISTLDGRTSSTCRALDLQQFEVGKGPMPPIHVNCRSSTIPKIEGIDLLSNTTRASPDGQVPADMSYYEWLKGQPAEFQDEVLGKSRGALFRQEEMTADRFTDMQLDKNFEPMTLDEMRTAAAGEFEVPRVPATAFDPLSDSEAGDAWLEGSLTDEPDEETGNVVYRYTSDGYAIYNPLLRDGDLHNVREDILEHFAMNVMEVDELNLEELLNEVRRDIATLADSLDRSALLNDTNLYRVIGRSSDTKYAVGDIVEDGGFMSFTVDRTLVMNSRAFEHLESKSRSVFKLRARAGDRGYLGTTHSTQGSFNEYEVIRKGGRFRIVDIDEDGFYVIEPIGD